MAAAIGIWLNEDTFQLIVYRVHTPYHDRVTFRMEGDNLAMEQRYLGLIQIERSFTGSLIF